MSEEQSPENAPIVKPEEKVTIASIDSASSNDLKSKKFIAYLISIGVSLGVFVFVYLKSNSSNDFQKYLDFLLYGFIAYVGGNSVERITNKLGK